jgi:DNA-binding NarL/FixJ family response regulator
MNKLSYREIEIMNHIACGFTAKEIARKTGLEHRTVEIYMSNIRKKLSAKNVAHAVYIACQTSLINAA